MMVSESGMMAGLRAAAFGLALACAIAFPARGEGLSVGFGGVGWVQYGQVGHSSDTLPNDYNGNPMQNSGAQITVNASITERLSGSVGLGVYEGHALAGQIASGGRVAVAANPYIAAANFTWTLGEKAAPLLQLTGGLFHFHYDDNIKDLGAYLLRGSVYPGFIMSGFETADVVPLANVLGLWARNRTGNLTSDLLIKCETDLKPYFDLSVAYIGRARLADFLALGAGVNFYRALANDSKLSHDPFDPVFEKTGPVTNPWQREFIYVDSSAAGKDTTYFGFDGTKLMADFEFDPKPFFGATTLGPEDLKLYGEVALLGLSLDKAHKEVYGGVANRLPIMIGFNLPAFGFLDHLSIETEWYAAKFRDDTWRMQPDIDRPVSPIPFDYSNDGKTYKRDNLKWALHAARTIQGHFKVSGQVANDHFRPYGIANTPATYEVATSTPKDWYWMAKIAYFF